MPPFHEESNIYRNTIIKRDNNNPILMTEKINSRTHHKLQLQRLSFLTNDKNYLDHPENMRRLTRELDRVDKEYRNVRKYEDPIKESFQRLLDKNQKNIHSTSSLSIHNLSEGENENDLSRSTGSITSNHSFTSQNDSIQSSSSVDKMSFLTRWFNSSDESTIQNSNLSHHSSQSIAYSFHPTIATQMKQRKLNILKKSY